MLGTAGYTLLEGWSLVESFYMTMITVTTVGFNEVREMSTTGRMFTVALMILGVGTLFYGIAIIAEVRFEERIRQIFGRRKLVKELDRLENHHIICGYGRIGSTVAAEYARESLPHVIIENDESIISHLDQEGQLVILGDATLDETLAHGGARGEGEEPRLRPRDGRGKRVRHLDGTGAEPGALHPEPRGARKFHRQDAGGGRGPRGLAHTSWAACAWRSPF